MLSCGFGVLRLVAFDEYHATAARLNCFLIELLVGEADCLEEEMEPVRENQRTRRILENTDEDRRFRVPALADRLTVRRFQVHAEGVDAGVRTAVLVLAELRVLAL